MYFIRTYILEDKRDDDTFSNIIFDIHDQMIILKKFFNLILNTISQY